MSDTLTATGLGHLRHPAVKLEAPRNGNPELLDWTPLADGDRVALLDLKDDTKGRSNSGPEQKRLTEKIVDVLSKGVEPRQVASLLGVTPQSLVARWRNANGAQV